MTTWTSLHQVEAALLGRKFFTEPGQYNYTVPASAKYVRAQALGCGGQGGDWGGGGALARTTVAVTPGDNLKIQVGDVSTSSTPGDSWVKRNDNSVIAYADRGRGNGNKGLASNSIGDVTQDGSPAGVNTGGAPAGDSGLYDTQGFGGLGALYAQTRTADYGGGGHTYYDTNESGTLVFMSAWGAGTGLVVLEFFDSNPGY